MFVLLPHGGATLAGKRSSWYPGLHGGPGWREVCGPRAQGTSHPVPRASRWCQDTGVGGRPSRRGSRRTRPTSLGDGPGQIGQERSVPEVRWPRSPPGQFLMWSEVLSHEPCCHMTPPGWGPRGGVVQRGDLSEQSRGCWPRGGGPAGQGLCGGGR